MTCRRGRGGPPRRRTVRGEGTMRYDGPATLEGPLSRSRSCWQEEAAPDYQAPPDGPDELLRWELIDRVRSEIAQGTYDTDERWQRALDRLLDELGRG